MSVISSARRSTTSVFDVVTETANAATKLIRTGTAAIDALEAKTRRMREEVVYDCALQSVLYKDSALVKAASDYCDAMEEAHNRNFPNDPFDRKSFYDIALQRMEAALAAEDAN